jgi:hypothetical protein
VGTSSVAGLALCVASVTVHAGGGAEELFQIAERTAIMTCVTYTVLPLPGGAVPFDREVLLEVGLDVPLPWKRCTPYRCSCSQS